MENAALELEVAEPIQAEAEALQAEAEALHVEEAFAVVVQQAPAQHNQPNEEEEDEHVCGRCNLPRAKKHGCGKAQVQHNKEESEKTKKKRRILRFKLRRN